MLINNSKKGLFGFIQGLPLWARRGTAKFLVGLLSDYLDNLPVPVEKKPIKLEKSEEDVSDVKF